MYKNDYIPRDIKKHVKVTKQCALQPPLNVARAYLNKYVYPKPRSHQKRPFKKYGAVTLI